MRGKLRLGIMGGTFDPIHMGHLIMAEAVRDEFGLDRVLFIPAAHPPHKQGRWDLAGAEHRYRMTELAVRSNPYFDISDMELHRKEPSYSVVTIDRLRESYGQDAEFYFITGADAINELFTWYHAEELLEKCCFIAANRQGTELDMELLRSHFGELAEKRIHQLVTPAVEISSTDIRQRIHRGRSINYRVPAAVEEYIDKEGLYREPDNEP